MAMSVVISPAELSLLDHQRRSWWQDRRLIEREAGGIRCNWIVPQQLRNGDHRLVLQWTARLSAHLRQDRVLDLRFLLAVIGRWQIDIEAFTGIILLFNNQREDPINGLTAVCFVVVHGRPPRHATWSDLGGHLVFVRVPSGMRPVFAVSRNTWKQNEQQKS